MQSLSPRPRKIQPACPRRRLGAEQLHPEGFRVKGKSRDPPTALSPAEILRVLDLGHTLVGGERAGRDAQEVVADYALAMGEDKDTTHAGTQWHLPERSTAAHHREPGRRNGAFAPSVAVHHKPRGGQ